LTSQLAQRRVETHFNRRFGIAEHFMESLLAHPYDDEHWADKRPDLSAIEVPALVSASRSDQGLHTRGTLLGFAQFASPDKWL
jgi:predicted acyl esterase